eukprot:2449274-Pyramimonas_sp.AAC.1
MYDERYAGNLKTLQVSERLCRRSRVSGFGPAALGVRGPGLLRVWTCGVRVSALRGLRVWTCGVWVCGVWLSGFGPAAFGSPCTHLAARDRSLWTDPTADAPPPPAVPQDRLDIRKPAS